MVLKIVGSLLVITFSTIAGFKLGNDYKSRILELKMLKQFLILLRGEIKYHKTPINEALSNIYGRSGKNIDVMLKVIIDDIKSSNKKEFAKIWEHGIIELKKETNLTDEDLQKLAQFGANIGFLDKETQINNIDLYLEKLEEDIKNLMAKLDEKCRIYNVCGVLTGIFIVLLIV